MIKTFLIIALLLVGGCSNTASDKHESLDKPITGNEPKIEITSEDETNVNTENDNICISGVFTEDYKCVIAEFRKIRLNGIEKKAYDISTKDIETNADEIIALAIDLTRQSFSDTLKEKRYGLDEWNRDNISFTPYLYYEFEKFKGVAMEFKDDLGNHGSSMSETIASKWLIINDISYMYDLAILGDTKKDTAKYKHNNYGGCDILSRKGNVIKLIDVLDY